MQAYVTPTELYEASRETCIRLYMANGGDKRAQWRIQTYPGTAAISCSVGPRNVPVWSLAMPAFPLDKRLPRSEAKLIAAYTVHELLHALFTNFDVAEQARRQGVFKLLNCIEDCRIEFIASQGKLSNVSEARQLLETLNAYILDKAIASPSFHFDAPEQFAFVMGLVIFAEKHGYKSALPKDWRSIVAPRYVPLFELALSEFDALTSTQDALALALKLQQAEKTLPPPPPPPPAPAPAPQEGKGKPEAGKGKPEAGKGKPEAGKGKPEAGEDEAEGGSGSEAGEDEASEGKGGSGSEAGEDEAEGGSGSEAGESKAEGKAEGQGEGKGAPTKGEGKAEGGSGSGASLNGPDTLALGDDMQIYEEALAHIADLGQKPTRDHEQLGVALSTDAVTEDNDAFPSYGRASVSQAAQAIASPAKLRRHLTSAVKSPERVANDRHQLAGRLDLRNVVGLATSRADVYKRKIEDEGQEAVVSILLDVSTSMNSGGRIPATKAMALHMGDALKAAGIKFEVVTFTTSSAACAVTVLKPVNKQWNAETKGRVAAIRGIGGTAMLPAISFCAKRLMAIRGVTRKILLALTDGEDAYTQEANRFNCQRWRNKGIEIVGIGLMLDDTEQARVSFDGRCVQVNSCEELATKGLAALVTTLDAGAPKPEQY